MTPSDGAPRVTRFLVVAWLVLLGGALYLYGWRRDLIHAGLESAFSRSALIAGAIYLVIGSLRGFTLIPSTTLVVAAVAFFQPAPLLVLTLAGILISSASIYVFAESWRLDEYFERRHAPQVARMKALLQQHELPIIIGWSFFPLAPTDIICYVCGILRVDLRKCLLGVVVGEGAICAIYIYGGDYLLRAVHWRV